MKVIASTDEYTIYQRRDSRYAVKDASKRPVNGDAKVAILLKHELIVAPEPKAPEPEEEPAAEDADAQAADAEAGEAEAAEETEAEAEAETADEAPAEDGDAGDEEEEKA